MLHLGSCAQKTTWEIVSPLQLNMLLTPFFLFQACPVTLDDLDEIPNQKNESKIVLIAQSYSLNNI